MRVPKDKQTDENHAIPLHRVPKTPSERFMEVFGDFRADGRCHEDSFGRDVGREVVE